MGIPMADAGHQHGQLTPLCNTGVHPPPKSPQSTFDWYRATVPASLSLLTQTILDGIGPYPQISDGKGRFNYLYSRTIEQGGDRAATILHGGSNGHPNVEASGYRASVLAGILRKGGPHNVTRCDVAVDLFGDGLYRELSALGDRIADAHRIGWREITDRDPSKGNTTYLGSRQSTVFARIYEKGKADRAHHRHVDNATLDAWVRVELEVKPQKDMKAVAASMEPEAFWGISEWTSQLAQEALHMAPEPIPFHPRRMASDDRAWATMIGQYRSVIQRRCQNVHQGDRDALAKEFLSAVFDEG